MMPPSPSDMKDFASRFSDSEWERLCKEQIFLDTFVVDLKACRIIAEKILAGKHFIAVK